MHRHRYPVSAVVAVALCALALGLLAALAQAAGRISSRAPHVVVRATRYACAPGLPIPMPAPVPAASPAVEPVPQDILDAFSVLRRPAGPVDALPAAELTALRTRGLEPFDPAAARLLRTTPAGGKAWVVPVRDTSARVMRASPLTCIGARVIVPRRATTTPGSAPARPAVPAPAPPPAPPSTAPTVPAAVPQATTLTAPTAVPPATITTPAVPRPATPDVTPRPGLAVVATGDAPVGNGGALDDLVRGRAPVSTVACAGPDRKMTSVSGIVPDGVSAAFLTSPDGTAIAADVHDNAYSFVIAAPTNAEPRYVVWTGGDGTPHVQPLGLPLLDVRYRCPIPAGVGAGAIAVSPTGDGSCGDGHDLLPALPAPLRIRVSTTPRRAADERRSARLGVRRVLELLRAQSCVLATITAGVGLPKRAAVSHTAAQRAAARRRRVRLGGTPTVADSEQKARLGPG